MNKRILALSALVLCATACSASTRGRFVLPPNAQLEVNDKKVDVAPDGSAKMSAFGWGGARYKVMQNGKVVSQGKLDTKFRPISIIWPPFGMLYVPKGLDGDKTYDLSASEQASAK